MVDVETPILVQAGTTINYIGTENYKEKRYVVIQDVDNPVIDLYCPLEVALKALTKSKIVHSTY